MADLTVPGLTLAPSIASDAVSFPTTTDPSQRDTVGGAVSYIGTAKDTAAGMITSASTLLGNKAANGADASDGAGKIKQSERLFTVRPRSTPVDNKNAYSAERGPIASIKLLTTSAKADVLSVITADNGAAASTGTDSIVESLMSDGGYTDFLLTNVDVAFNEKVQINEVFGDSEVVYYFGRSPIQFNLSGILTDDVDNNWFYRFMIAYHAILRGTELAKNHMLVQINLPNMTVVGTISGMSYSQESTRDTDIRFNMQFLAKSIVPRPVLVPSELLSNNAVLLNINNLNTFPDITAINNIKRSVSSAKAYLGTTMGSGTGVLADAAAGISNFAGGLNAALGGAISGARDFFDNNVSGFLSVASLRANIIAPIYGVLTTLTKVVKSITGQILSLFSAGGSILSTVLKDIQSIANQAISLVNAIEGGINSIVNQVIGGINDIRKTIKAIKNAAGAISSAPEDISNILKRLSTSGRKKGYMASLKSGRVSKAHIALINSGSPRTATSGASLPG